MTQPPPASPPVAFRLKRPYASEDEFLAGDGHGIFKNGMVLIGAGPRPVGVIVRFEVALRDGAALFRGEGRVVVHRTTPQGERPAGLEVKFTRLDARGKHLVDRALADRASHRASSPDIAPKPAPAAIPDLAPARASDRISLPPSATSTGPVEAPPEPDDLAPTNALPPAAPAPPPSAEATEIAPPVALVEAAAQPEPEPETPTPAAPLRLVETPERTLPYEFPLKPAPGSVIPPRPSPDREAALGRLRARAVPNPPSFDVEARRSALERLRARTH